MNVQLYQQLKYVLMTYMILIQQISKKHENLLFQELRYMFADNPIVDFYFEGMNKHILISDNFETPNFEVMINANGYISITDDTSTVCYQVATESPVQLPSVKPVIEFEWSEFDVDSIISSFTSEVDLHRFMELLEVEVSILKQKLWLLNHVQPTLQLIQDEKLLKELTSLGEVA